jgi:deazaflavin-dependent oxidoreductase (nitroreductase family)
MRTQPTPTQPTPTDRTACCIAGGGPAGMMLGLLLARQGVEVLVLEKHADFLRDFRGDTVHPSTLELMAELGWLDALLRRPHTKLEHVTVDVAGRPVTVADFRKLPVRCPYVAFMPQWDFLDFLAQRGLRYPGFRLLQRTEVVDLIEESGRVAGVRARTPEGALEVRAALVVGADGRHSTVRARAGLEVAAGSPPMDVLWFRLSRRPGEILPFFVLGRGASVVCVDRGDYWQVAYVTPSRAYPAVRAAGLAAFRASIAATVPALGDRAAELGDWEDVKLLTVRVDRLRRWSRPGLLCIGDAAHAMSPAGGVGINLAIQDAVAAANLLGPTFRAGGPSPDDLRRVQRRRELPARVTQLVQVRALGGLYPKGLEDDPSERPPLAFQLFRRLPPLRHLTGYFIGVGIRPEHIRPAPLSGRRPATRHDVPAGGSHAGAPPARGRSARVPRWVRFFNPIARRLLAAGVPMGPNALVTVRGRTSGRPRTTPLTIIEASGRRWLISPYGEVNWVRNLRAAGRATITVRRRNDEVATVELGPKEAVEFFRDVLGPLVRPMRLGSWIVRNIDKVDLDNPVEAAAGRPVFELRLR